MVREYGLKFAPSLKKRREGTVTLTLPYAGTIRIRFRGLPGSFDVGLSVRQWRTPLALSNP